MKAIVRTRYGPPDVLQFKEIETPAPADNEVLIRLYAASANPLDLFHTSRRATRFSESQVSQEEGLPSVCVLLKINWR